MKFESILEVIPDSLNNLGKPRYWESNRGQSLVERAGYIPTKDRIENIIRAGQRLAATRSEQYDFQGDQPVDDSFYDMTRSQDFGLSEIGELAVAQELKTQEVINARKNNKSTTDASGEDSRISDKKSSETVSKETGDRSSNKVEETSKQSE